MRRSILLAAFLVLVALPAAAMAACSDAGDAASPAPSATVSALPENGPSPASGTKMAPGLYELEDGTVVAVGTVEYRDIEGGFWVVIDGSAAQGDSGTVVAVIANGDEFADQFRGDEGFSFEVYGERAGEVSVRMAGPEITATRVVLAAEGGPAE
jgi:hypothetical protein